MLLTQTSNILSPKEASFLLEIPLSEMKFSQTYHTTKQDSHKNAKQNPPMIAPHLASSTTDIITAL